MKHLILLSIFLVSFLVSAQTNFDKGMQKAFDALQENDMEEAENIFERISAAEPDQWLPHYYIAQINSIKSWNVKDEALLKQQLEKAQSHLDMAKKISPMNDEIMVLQANVLTNWVAYDGQTYGMKYSGAINELYTKANRINPNNPRVVSNKAEWDMGSAQFFGQDPKVYCKDLEKSLELFANFQAESPFHPQWGGERAKAALKNCQ